MGEQHLELVRVPAGVPAGSKRVEIRLGGDVVGDLDLRVCAQCRLAVLEHVRVAPNHRRRGVATRAVQAVLAEHPSCRWSTSPLEDSAESRSFWEAVSWPGTLGCPLMCAHMRQADEYGL